MKAPKPVEDDAGNMTNDPFYERMKIFNKTLKKKCRTDRDIAFSKIRGLKPNVQQFLSDGLHLTNNGYDLLAHSIKKDACHMLDACDPEGN